METIVLIATTRKHYDSPITLLNRKKTLAYDRVNNSNANFILFFIGIIFTVSII